MVEDLAWSTEAEEKNWWLKGWICHQAKNAQYFKGMVFCVLCFFFFCIIFQHWKFSQKYLWFLTFIEKLKDLATILDLCSNIATIIWKQVILVTSGCYYKIRLTRWLLNNKNYFSVTEIVSFPNGMVVKNCLPMKKMWVQSLGQEDPLEKKMATHFSIIAWKITWIE